MGMREEHGINALRIKREWLSIQIFALSAALKEATIQKQAKPINFNKMTRPSNRLRSAAKYDLHIFHRFTMR
jgi:hypothetical protein